MAKRKLPAIDPEKLYGTKEIAALAGRDDTKGLKSVGMILKRHNIGQVIGGGRVVPGTDVPIALDLIQNARSGNPDWIAAGKDPK